MAFSRTRIVLILVSLLLTACQRGGPTPTPSPTPTPAEISASVGKATQNSQTFHFMITLSGRPVFTDATRLFSITSVEGDLRRPDGVLAILKVKSVAGVAEIRSVSLASKQYFTNPITRAWQCLTPGAALDPAVLFDQSKGIEFLLQQGIENVTLVGTEDLNGRQHYHLRGTIPGHLLQAIGGGLFSEGPAQIDLWADRETLRASRIILVDPGTQPTTWTIDFSEYDKPVDVQAPIQC